MPADHAADIAQLGARPLKWLPDATTSPDQGIVLASRVRLARNFSDLQFPSLADEKERLEARDRILQASEEIDTLKSGLKVNLDDVDLTAREILFEHRAISAELVEGRSHSAVVFVYEDGLSVMANEEDHLRIQCLGSGLVLEDLWQAVRDLEREFSARFPLAYRDELGYLTACPSNVGTGLRASVMLHLPGLVMTGRIGPVVNAMHKLGFAVRGALGESDETFGDYFQLSNQATLGLEEANVIQELQHYVTRIIKAEDNARRTLLSTRLETVLDYIARAYGVMRQSWRLSAYEALGGLSAIYLGVRLGVIRSLGAKCVVKMMQQVQHGHFKLHLGVDPGDEQQDVRRAEFVRTAILGAETP